MSSDKDQLISIQYLRAFAALMVVVHHARNGRDWLFNPIEHYGAFAWGVDIFFVISGFIMYVAAKNENPLDFIGRRIIRVVPLYWFATLFLLALNTKLRYWLYDSEFIVHLVKSFLFIPQYSLLMPDQLWPYLIPGWTLNYEMIFYFVFFLGLITRRTLLVLSLAITGIFVGGLFIDSHNAIIRAYSDPVILEFLCGVWVGYAYLKGYFRRNLSYLLFVGFIVLFALPFLKDKTFVMAGRIVCATMIIAGTVSLGKKTSYNKLLNIFGDASYSIYLTHTVVSMRWSVQLWKGVPVDGWLQFIGWVFLTLIISSVVGILVYLYLEKPVLRWLRKKWKNIMNRGLS